MLFHSSFLLYLICALLHRLLYYIVDKTAWSTSDLLKYPHIHSTEDYSGEVGKIFTSRQIAG